jgi:uncharacterized membrane protein YjjB (DUF3815 family)
VLTLKDNVPTRNFPVVTIGLIAANVVVWICEVKTGVNIGGFAFGAATVGFVAKQRPLRPSW